MNILLSNEFDTYLVPNSEPEFERYIDLVEQKIKEIYPDADVMYHNGRNLVISSTPEKNDEILEVIGQCYQEAYDKIATSQAARTLGKLGGSVKSERKSAAARKNGKLGGRPKKMSYKDI